MLLTKQTIPQNQPVSIGKIDVSKFHFYFDIWVIQKQPNTWHKLRNQSIDQPFSCHDDVTITYSGSEMTRR